MNNTLSNDHRKLVKYRCPCCDNDILIDDRKLRADMITLGQKYTELLAESKKLRALPVEERTTESRIRKKEVELALKENKAEMQKYKNLRTYIRRSPEYNKEFMNYERLAMQALLDHDTYKKVIALANQFYNGVVEWEYPIVYREKAEVEDYDDMMDSFEAIKSGDDSAIDIEIPESFVDRLLKKCITPKENKKACKDTTLIL